ncbi:hypothetical protein PT286_01845 [Neisseriaceae bacterium ESL0693]|nr:hypothetical protein [Neisseriaceae bacterium ESL0693]
MKSYKLMLLGALSALSIQSSHAEIVRYGGWVLGSVNYVIVDVVCKHTYTNEEIMVLEKSADQGDSLAQLKLGILYDIKSMQRYQQVHENQNVSSNSKEIAQILSKQRSSPCIHINNTAKE